MNEIIIPKSDKVKSITPNETGGLDYVLVNGTKLGDIDEDLPFLPNGIINKGITGIGATTMELNCNRNSIIIQPLKVTVELKSMGSYAHKVFAYGSKASKSLNRDLADYLEDKDVEYKKIILVIDRLFDLVEALGVRVENYFMLFDEIDYMQGSSTYRKKMEVGLDLGKVINNYALVSATHIGFTDPDFKRLKTYNFKYENKEFREVQFFYLTDVVLKNSIKEKATQNQLFSCIVHMIQKSESKILVAINNVKLIKEIADELVKKEVILEQDISLLISDNNLKNKLLIEKYSGLSISEEKLPTKLNFITSAYFNGYDLKEEDLCLIIYSSPNFKTNLITSNEIKQIYGRNRLDDGTTKFFIFTHDVKEEELEDAELLSNTEEEWISRGESSVEMQNCIDKHLHKLSGVSKKNNYFTKFFKEQTESMAFNLSRSKSIFNKENYLQVLYNRQFKQEEENVISYLQIDHLRYYYNYLKEMYVMFIWDIAYEENGEEKQEIFYDTVKYGLIESLYKSGFIETKDKVTWDKLLFKPEKVTHRMEIEEAIEQLELLKNLENYKNATFLQKQIVNIVEIGRKVYSIKSIKETLNQLQTRDEVGLLYEYVKDGDFKKSNRYILLKNTIKVKHPYSTDELIDLATNAEQPEGTKTKISKKGALQLIRLVFKIDLKHKAGSKKGEKMYYLTHQNPFRLLSKSNNSKSNKKKSK